MFHRFLPIYNAFRRKLSSVPTMDDVCDSKEIICEAEQSYVPGVSIDDHCRGLITEAIKVGNLEVEQRRIDGYMGNHQATIKYKFSNVLATPNGFHVLGTTFLGNGKDYLGPLLPKKIPVIEKGFYATSFVTTTFFGHWLTDGVPGSLLKQPDETLYLWSPASWHHASDYLKALGIERINAKYVFFKTMSFCNDIGMNTNRRNRINQIKKALQPINKEKGAKRVYLSRGRSGALRTLINEDELIEVLSRLGFRIVSVYDTFDDIIASCAGADLTVSLEGSNTAHLTMSSCFGADHVIINPADKFGAIFVDYTLATGDKIHSIVAPKDGNEYRVDVPRLVSVIKKIIGS